MGVNGTLGLYFMPVFLALIAVELMAARRRGLTLYTKGETLASVGVALGQRLLGLLPFSLLGAAGLWLFDHRLLSPDIARWESWVILFVLMEFFYYWFHRASHEIRWFWATHAVHHSIREMNILGSYRLGWTGRFTFAGIFWLPMMWVGFPPSSVVLMLSLNLFYQSWIHTVLIDRLGPLEGWLNTPSAHRVHHATNAPYLDRNYGGVTLVFDRLFGTYAAERADEPCVYGLLRNVESTNPLVIAFHEWGRIATDLGKARLTDWPGYLFGMPGWAPNGAGRTSRTLRTEYEGRQDVMPAPDAGLARPAR